MGKPLRWGTQHGQATQRHGYITPIDQLEGRAAAIFAERQTERGQDSPPAGS